MAYDRVSLAEINDRAAESAEQDQTARTCSLILLYTLRKIHSLSRTVVKRPFLFKNTIVKNSKSRYQSERVAFFVKFGEKKTVRVHLPVLKVFARRLQNAK